jgi:hypothetical protein
VFVCVCVRRRESGHQLAETFFYQSGGLACCTSHPSPLLRVVSCTLCWRLSVHNADAFYRLEHFPPLLNLNVCLLDSLRVVNLCMYMVLVISQWHSCSRCCCIRVRVSLSISDGSGMYLHSGCRLHRRVMSYTRQDEGNAIPRSFGLSSASSALYMQALWLFFIP